MSSAPALALLSVAVGAMRAAEPETPHIDGSWWRIAAPPALERWAKPGIQTVDFTIYRSGDGRWQLVSCIRGTAAPGKGRLLYRWSADRLDNADWTPCGIFAESDPSRGQLEGCLTSPHCVRDGATWRMFCGSAGARCLESRDGIHFTWAVDAAGDGKFFDMARDLMLFDNRAVDGRWYGVFTDIVVSKYPERKNHTVAYRTAADLAGPWSAKKTDIGVLSPPPAPGDAYPFAEAESPFVVRRGDWYYRWEQMDVYASRSLSDWSGARRVELIPGKRRSFLAPEIVDDGGASYIAAYHDNGKDGIFLAKLAWSAP